LQLNAVFDGRSEMKQEHARDLRRVAGWAAIAGLGLLMFAWLERRGWVREMEAQCKSMQPLLARGAGRDEVVGSIGAPSSDNGAGDLAWLTEQFESTRPKLASIERNVHGSTRVLIYSRSNSIMFVYVDGTAKAVGAECFLQ
jgi:hypothetical protein